MWAEPLLLAKCGEIEKIYALDYSKHRIFKLGTELLSSKNIPDDKVSLVFGSFYNLRLEAGSLDFVFMSQAFHHAEEPESLLAEIKRVLRPGGIVVIIGEHYAEMGLKVYLANTVKFIISKTFPVFTRKSLSGKKFEGIKLFPGFDDVYKKDTLTGDHYYSLKKYMEMFRNSGFSAWHIKTGGLYQAFVLVRD
jgi:ubiquinone/menaquinone biosynthesis C-methylase UbiE